MNKHSIPYGRQNITPEDIDAVIRVLQGEFLTQGPAIAAFEQAFSAVVQAPYAVAVNSATTGLHLAALVSGMEPGKKAIVPAITFAASANCIKYCGGEPIFADIDPNTFTLDLNHTEDLLKKDNKITAIVAVDFAGYPVNMEALKQLSDRFGCSIIEDACHAPGGYFTNSAGKNEFCGNGAYGQIASFSFHPVKHIACGEGGMVTTADKAVYKRLLKLRTHGITKNPDELQENQGGWYYEMQELGYNYRLPDILAALGTSQLTRMEENLRRRRELAARYNQLLQGVPVVLPEINQGHAWHLYVIQTTKRKELYNYLREAGIFAQVHYIPVPHLPYYRQLGNKKGNWPAAEKYYEQCLSIPMYHSLTDGEQDFVVETIRKFYS
jgi:UDP-4-amino-4,6-dideoxy-N-acetyl-beta-L-altrosamine transaminase